MIRIIVWDVMGVVLGDEGPNLELISLAQKIRETGVPCVLGTNLSSTQASRIWEDFGLKEHFDEIFASGNLGAWKPDQMFFKAVQDELDVLYDNPPQQNVLFIDDSRDNVAAAEAFGWRSECFGTMEKLHEDLRTYKVTFEQGDL